MASHTPDPLIGLTRFLIAALLVLVLFPFALAGILLLASLAFQSVDSPFGSPDPGLPPAAYWGAIAGFYALLVVAALFLQRLNRILGTVEAGDPFSPANAEHLARMAWLALAAQLIALPLGAAESAVASSTGGKISGFGSSGALLLLALTCFVLARVFRSGAAMREELESTV